MARSTVVLVHGAWHGSWCWSKVTQLLSEQNVEVVTVELPLTSLADDVAVTVEAIAAIDGPVVLCGHSYGGVVVSEGGGGANVEHVVFLCALAVDVGFTAMRPTDVEGLPSTELGAALAFAADGSTVTLDPARVRDVLYNGCSDDDAAASMARLRGMAVSCLATPTTIAAWRTTPSTYVVCTDDHTVHPELQRILARPHPSVIEWDVGHSPFLNRPDLVADLLAGLAR